MGQNSSALSPDCMYGPSKYFNHELQPLADFGLAVFFDPKQLPLTDLGMEGTPWFMAPEMLSCQVNVQ